LSLSLSSLGQHQPLCWWNRTMEHSSEKSTRLVPCGLAPDERRASSPTLVRQERFGLFHNPLKPVLVESVGHGPSAETPTCPHVRTHTSIAAAVGSSEDWAIRTMVWSTVAEVARRRPERGSSSRKRSASYQ